MKEIDQSLETSHYKQIRIFLDEKLVPKYKLVYRELGDIKFFFRLMKNAYDIIKNADFFPYVGFIKEMILSVAFINLHYTVYQKNTDKLMGLFTSSSKLAKKYYHSDLEKLVQDPNKIYQFLSDVYTSNFGTKIQTMIGINDTRYSALIRDIWYATLLDPKHFVKNWYHDYVIDKPNIDKEILVDLSWRKANNLFGYEGLYKNYLTPVVANSDFFSNNLKATKDILKNKDTYEQYITNANPK